MRSPWHESPRRRALWFGLIVSVVLAHGLFAAKVAANLVSFDDAAEPRRIDVDLVKALAPAAPPPGGAVLRVAAAAPVPLARAAAAPALRPSAPRAKPPGASGPNRRASAPSLADADAAPASAPPPALASSSSRDELRARALALAATLAGNEPGGAPPSVASAASGAASATVASAVLPGAPGSVAIATANGPTAATVPAGPTLDWPPSTRLTYTLTGLFRDGPLYGNAVVEWRREGAHYQVQFDIHVQPFFDQHMFSDGRIADDGLRPEHYAESRKFPLAAARGKKIEFGDDEVTLANGTRVARLPQSQDPASQFVQFVWMFTLHPEWLRPGNVVEMPLALPNNLRRWRYEVAAPETLRLPFGAIAAVHLVPRPDGPRRANEYPFEIWMAPTLAYLPVRIHVQLDDRNFADLALDSAPLQAAPSPVPASPRLPSDP